MIKLCSSLVVALVVQATAMLWAWNWFLAPALAAPTIRWRDALAAWVFLGMATSASTPKGPGSAVLDPLAEVWVGLFGMAVVLLVRWCS